MFHKNEAVNDNPVELDSMKQKPNLNSLTEKLQLMSTHVNGVEKATIVKTSAQLKMSLVVSVRKENILVHNIREL